MKQFNLAVSQSDRSNFDEMAYRSAMAILKAVEGDEASKDHILQNVEEYVEEMWETDSEHLDVDDMEEAKARYCDQFLQAIDESEWLDARNIKTIQLSKATPAQGMTQLKYAGHTAGDQATIFYSVDDESYGYCYHGIGNTDLAYESEDVTGFTTAEEAEAEARANYSMRSK